MLHVPFKGPFLPFKGQKGLKMGLRHTLCQNLFFQSIPRPKIYKNLNFQSGPSVRSKDIAKRPKKAEIQVFLSFLFAPFSMEIARNGCIFHKKPTESLFSQFPQIFIKNFSLTPTCPLRALCALKGAKSDKNGVAVLFI